MLKKIRNKVYFWRVTTSKCHPFGGMAQMGQWQIRIFKSNHI